MSRCEHSGTRGQCPHQSVDMSPYCSRHSDPNDQIKGYRLASPELSKRLGHDITDEDALLTVKGEIILLRILIEERLNLATSKAEKEAAFSAVVPALNSVNKLVESLVKLGRTTNQVLGKDTIQSLGESIVEILINELNDIPDSDDLIDRIAMKIAEAVVGAENPYE